jgi:protein-S-isoprenylcysteine O-methyltransferase Ste14
LEEVASNTTRAGQHIANVSLAAWLAADAVRLALFARDLEADIAELVAAALFLMTAVFVLRRLRPRAQDARIGTVILALLATMLPVLLALLAPAQRTTTVALVMQGAALMLMGAGLLFLGSNFSIVPQYRKIVTNGPYSFIRHPIYGSYLIFDGVLALEAQSWIAGALWLAEGILLLARARFEERLLATSDPDYTRYLARVRWRFVPGVV